VTGAQWTRLKSLFHQALEIPDDERAAWLEREAAGDPDLVAQAKAMLSASGTLGGFLERPLELGADDVAAVLGGAALVAGDRIGPYEIVRELGRGGMGVVYLARDVRLGREVALKALPAETAADPARRERLKREARAAATIAHPAVATIYALEDIDGHLFIASEYVDGRSLRDVMADAPLPRERAVALALEIVDALCAAHAAGVVHRDLKPENVLLTPDGRAKVVDFGIAYLQVDDAPRLTMAGDILGTPAYMAPEQLAGGAVDGRTDLYAVGVMLGEMVTGRHPLASGARPFAGTPLDAVIWRCLQADPAARVASAVELRAALAALANRPGSAASDAHWWWRFHQGVVALAYAALLVPVWLARGLMGGRAGLLVFLLLMASGIVAITLRLHLWFVSRVSREDLAAQRAHAAPWLRGADVVFAAGLMGSGVFVGADGPALAVVLSAAAVVVALAFLVIEPSTARAAFRSEQTGAAND
jgi:predicted Ser/Thr protein kinase